MESQKQKEHRETYMNTVATIKGVIEMPTLSKKEMEELISKTSIITAPLTLPVHTDPLINFFIVYPDSIKYGVQDYSD